MNQPQEQLNTGIVNIRGKNYSTVAKRVHDFRHDARFQDWQIVTEPVHIGEEAVVFKCTIFNFEGRPQATGHAEEFRASSKINRTSAVENCETSSIGRALANLGFAGTQFASAEEVQSALEAQRPIDPVSIKVIQSLMEDGLVTDEHLRVAFGTTVISELYQVEANRVIEKFAGSMPPTPPAQQEVTE